MRANRRENEARRPAKRCGNTLGSAPEAVRARHVARAGIMSLCGAPDALMGIQGFAGLAPRSLTIRIEAQSKRNLHIICAAKGKPNETTERRI
jgi:hypothetical protein